jgi:hypothetical protein
MVPRCVLYLRQYPLWIDEARLALNLGTRSFGALIQPLAYDQSGPVLFLWLQRLIVSLVGLNELSLRLVPLLAGLLTIILVYRIGTDLGGTAAGVWAALFLALSPHMTKYAVEDKQYTVEGLITATLTVAFIRWTATQTPERTRILVLICLTAVWWSSPAVFVLAGLSVAVLLSRSTQRVRGTLAKISVGWALSFVLAYLISYRYATSSTYMARYWHPAYLTPGGSDYWYRLEQVFDGIFWATLMGRTPFHDRAVGATVFVWAATATFVLVLGLGLCTAARNREGVLHASFLAIPLLVTAGASTVGLYPMAPRTMVFAAPLIYVTAALGVAQLGRLANVGLRVAALIATGGLLTTVPATLTFRELIRTVPLEDTRSIARIVPKHRRPGEVVYVSAGALPTYAFYSTDWSSPDAAKLHFYETAGSSRGGAFQNAASRNGPVPPGEGRTLVRTDGAGPLLLGIPTGIEANAFGIIGTNPDPGWAEHEARRVCEWMGLGNAWLVLSFMDPSELQLATAMRACSSEVSIRPAGLTSALLIARGKRVSRSSSSRTPCTSAPWRFWDSQRAPPATCAMRVGLPFTSPSPDGL